MGDKAGVNELDDLRTRFPVGSVHVFSNHYGETIFLILREAEVDLEDLDEVYVDFVDLTTGRLDRFWLGSDLDKRSRRFA